MRAAFLSDGAPLRPIDETVRLLGHGVAAAAADVVQQPVHARVVDAYDCGALVEQGVPLARWLTAAGLSVRVAADLRLVEAALPSSRPQSTNCLLMVAPTAFSFNAEAAVDNAFMAGSAGEEGGAAGVRSAVLREHAGLVATLRRAGVTVHLFAHEEAHGTPGAASRDAR